MNIHTAQKDFDGKQNLPSCRCRDITHVLVSDWFRTPLLMLTKIQLDSWKYTNDIHIKIKNA